MILKKIGNTQLLCSTSKKPEGKWFKASSAVMAFAKKSLKVGDNFKAEFDDNWVIQKINKLNVEKGKGSVAEGGQYEKMVERSVYASVATMVSSMNLSNGLKEVKAIVQSLFEQGMELVKGKKVEKIEPTEEPKDEPEEEPSEEPED